MLYSKYKIVCRFLEDGTLNSFAGSALRGAFGHALKKAVCTVREKDCDCCILHRHCLFAQFYMEQKTSNDEKSASIPHPYIIEPPQNYKQHYAKNDFFEFSLILLGKSYEKLPFIIYAFELMGSQGIGRANNHERKNTPFEIVDIVACHSPEQSQIYDSAKKLIIANIAPISLAYTKTNFQIESPQKLTISLDTALRYKVDNSFNANLTFEILYKLMVRRISVAFKEFGNCEIDIDYKNLLYLSQQIEIIENNTYWEEQNRYSNRQKLALKIGGVRGNITFKGDFVPFLPLLDLATLLHLGKQTSFGLGKIHYTFT